MESTRQHERKTQQSHFQVKKKTWANEVNIAGACKRDIGGHCRSYNFIFPFLNLHSDIHSCEHILSFHLFLEYATLWTKLGKLVLGAGYTGYKLKSSIWVQLKCEYSQRCYSFGEKPDIHEYMEFFLWLAARILRMMLMLHV